MARSFEATLSRTSPTDTETRALFSILLGTELERAPASLEVWEWLLVRLMPLKHILFPQFSPVEHHPFRSLGRRACVLRMVHGLGFRLTGFA